MPEFPFSVWLAGLVTLVIALALVTPLLRRGPRALRVFVIGFAGLMVLNGAGHILGTIAGRTVSSVRFARPMPGFWSSPVLMAAAIHAIVRIRQDVRSQPGPTSI